METKKSLHLISLIATVLILSCNTQNPQPVKLTKLNAQRLLTPGEWISEKDTMAGISIRENKMAFFSNMVFKSEDIYEYELIDSIYKFSEREDKVGEYILAKDFNDTIYYQIITKSDSSLMLKIDNQAKTFYLKKKSR